MTREKAFYMHFKPDLFANKYVPIPFDPQNQVMRRSFNGENIMHDGPRHSENFNYLIEGYGYEENYPFGQQGRSWLWCTVKCDRFLRSMYEVVRLRHGSGYEFIGARFFAALENF